VANDPKALADVLKPDVTYPNGEVDWGKNHYSAADFAKLQTQQTGIGGTPVQIEVLKDVKSGHIPGSEETVSPNHTTFEQWRANSTIDKDGNLVHGKVTIDKDLVPFIDRIGQRQPPDPELAAMLEKASNDPSRTHHITSTAANDSHAPGGDVVVDPEHGFKDYHNEGNVQPERIFKHELGHALMDPEKQRVLLNIPDGVNTNKEEARALMIERRHALSNELQRYSHEANAGSDLTMTDPNHAPQTSDRPELLVHMGADGHGALKGKGTVISGEVSAITHKDGFTTITLGEGARAQSISFPETTRIVAGDPGEKNPLNNVTDNVAPHDKIKLTIGRDGESATLQNFTQSAEVTMHRNGDVAALNKDFSKEREAVPAR
jgi:hypothetical protein